MFKVPPCLSGASLDGLAGKESTCNVGDLADQTGLIPALGRFPGEGKCYPLRYAGLENSMDCTVSRAAKSQTGVSRFHSLPQIFYLQIDSFC